jgi:hypothetical protein
MWLSDVDFGGLEVSGTLLSSPNWLKSVSEGDSMKLTDSGCRVKSPLLNVVSRWQLLENQIVSVILKDEHAGCCKRARARNGESVKSKQLEEIG